MNNQDLECKNITTPTKIKSNNGTLSGIIKTNQWMRICPICNNEIYHTSKCNRDRLQKLNVVCKKCKGKSQRLYKNIDELVRICKKCGKLTHYKNRKSFNQAEKQNRLCCYCSPKPECSQLTKLKISFKNKGENNGMFGKTHSYEYKKLLQNKMINNKLHNTPEGIEKMRISLRRLYSEKFIKTGHKHPRVNIKACSLIDEYGNQNGYNFQHGLNGGEVYFKNVGVWVDGYDKNKNVVFEYDEKHHFNTDGVLKDKDKKRMDDIKKHIGCKIIRYNSILNQFNNY